MLRTRRIDRIQRRASAALINAQHELAFRKRRVRNDGKDPELDSLVAGWRDEIRHLQAAVLCLLLRSGQWGASANRREAVSAAPEPSLARAPGAVVVCGIACMPTRCAQMSRAIGPCSTQELPTVGHSGTTRAKKAAGAR